MEHEIINNIEKIQLDIEYINNKEVLQDYIYNMENYNSKELKDFMELYIIDQLNEMFDSFDPVEMIIKAINLKLTDLIVLMNNRQV